MTLNTVTVESSRRLWRARRPVSWADSASARTTAQTAPLRASEANLEVRPRPAKTPALGTYV
eukprot:5682565-Alexandrium_andersonii.AAC.1